jgi:Fe-S cluster biogenesis protein NfuA
MATTVDVQSFRGRMQRLESLIHGIEHGADPAAKAAAQEVVQSLLDLHASAFQNVLAHLDEAGQAGQALIHRLADDEIISGLLLLYGLHPHDLETRVRSALDKLRPQLTSHGGDVELVSVIDGAVRLRVHGGGGCCSSGAAVKGAIEEALYEKAPDLESLHVEEVSAPATTFVPVAELSLRDGAARTANLAER